MADITINGVDIDFDLEQITITEYRKFAKGQMLNAEDDIILAKVSGQTVEYIQALSHSSYRRMLSAFFKKAREPLADPN